MSKIKPVYQSQTGGVWHDVTDKEYAFRRELSGVYQTRILYPAAAYEALQKELAQAKEESQNYENASRITHEWNVQIGLANGELRKANEAQAKRIAHLEYKIDELLLEWCPDEMTKEQLENYANHQRKASL